MTCEESTEERCFKLLSLDDTAKTIEKCTTTMAEPKCSKVTLDLPAQKCSEELRRVGQSYGYY